jgi:hypothetical protein
MARASQNKLYRTFVKGLVTEASPLTYPEDTSYDERNTILSRKGSRTRRQGINYELNTLVPGFTTNDTYNQQEFIWKAVAKEANTNFLVLQKGLDVKFFDASTTVYEESVKNFTVNLGDHLIPGWSAEDAATQMYQLAAGKGFLFIVGRPIRPLAIEYLPDTDTIVVSPLNLLIRDFDGLNDGLANDEEPAVLTKEHHYNLFNQGWLYGSSSATTYSPVSYDGYTISEQMAVYDQYNPQEIHVKYNRATPTTGPINLFYQKIGRYPGNNKQWWVARAEADNPDENVKAGDFLPLVLNNLYSGNNRAPNGHFILDAFYKDRSALSGISNIPVETVDYRPEAVAFFSGRAWYGAGSTVYFSQIIDSTGIHKAALCYQEADPTAEDISDLIASDGGVVPIPEADRIRKLVPMGNGVLVLAQNGVWFVSGGDSAFSAISISVSKVSSIGTKSPYAAFEVDETLFWWNETGIQAMQQASGQFGPIPGKFGNSSISEQTIQTMFNAIPETAKQFVKGAFDPRNNCIYWLFNDIDEKCYEYNKAIVYDLTLQAFFLWEFNQIEGGPRINGIYNNIGESFVLEEVAVLDNTGDTVVNIDNVTVTSKSYSRLYSPSSIQFVTSIPSGTVIAGATDTNFVDWASFDGTGIEYDSYVETGFELMSDAMRDKQAVYVFCHFSRQDNSSCKFITKWDWANSASSNRWSTEVEAYRERNRPTNSYADLEAFDVVTTKNKVRGSGKSIQFRFGTSEAGKNFEILGWSVAFSGNTQP